MNGGSNKEQDHDGGSYITDITLDSLLEIVPRNFEKPHCQPHADSGREQQRDLARTKDGIAPEYTDVQ